VLLVDHSMHASLGAGAPICPAGLTLRSDCAEVRVEVDCDLMKMSHILSSWTH
jgi:hypothetical protein